MAVVVEAEEEEDGDRPHVTCATRSATSAGSMDTLPATADRAAAAAVVTGTAAPLGVGEGM